MKTNPDVASHHQGSSGSSGRIKMTDKDELVKKAELAGKDGRYDEMATFMKAAAETGTELSVNEMFSLRIAYCNVFRALWSEISSIKQKTDTSVYGSDEYDEDEEVRKFFVCSVLQRIQDMYVT